jgi:hypothetical protein
MASVVTEHMLLLVPMMMVVMIFPMVAGFVVNNYNNQQQLLAVEQASAKLGSSIQQIYLAASVDNVKDCTLTLDNPIPENLEGQQYLVTGSQEGENLVLHIGLPGINLWYDNKITIGQNAVWDPNSVLDSNSPTAGIIAKKVSGIIYLCFG